MWHLSSDAPRSSRIGATATWYVSSESKSVLGGTSCKRQFSGGPFQGRCFHCLRIKFLLLFVSYVARIGGIIDFVFFLFFFAQYDHKFVHNPLSFLLVLSVGIHSVPCCNLSPYSDEAICSTIFARTRLSCWYHDDDEMIL